jgi:protein TonB
MASMRTWICFLSAFLGACAAPAPEAPAGAAAPARAAPPPARHAPAANLDAYKRQVAERIVKASPYVYEGPVQPLLKSIVVLDISIDAQGRLQRVAVRRSNGFKDLENRALESVRRAAPFAAPPRERGVSYLETFLFRDDGRFRVRSLVES